MIKNSFRQILAGLLFIAADFKINGFDLVPDIVGYALIVFGLGSLSALDPSFGKARRCAIVLLCASLLDFISFPQTTYMFNTASFPFHPLPALIAVVILPCIFLLVWYTGEGMLALTNVIGNEWMIRSTTERGRFLLITLVVGWLGALALLFFPDPLLALLVGIISAIFYLIAAVSLVHLLWRAGDELEVAAERVREGAIRTYVPRRWPPLLLVALLVPLVLQSAQVVSLTACEIDRLSLRATVPAASPSPLAAPPRGKIAFMDLGVRPDQLSVIQADGSKRTSLSDMYWMQARPVWSPDGQRIAFIRYADSAAGRPNDAVYIIDPDGGAPLRVAENGLFGFDLSPDGRRLVYTREMVEAYIVAIGGGQPERLTVDLGSVLFPKWSPDGQYIAFASYDGIPDDNDLHLYRSRPDGTDLVLLASDGGMQPAWSPDGQHIVFKRSGDVYMVNWSGRCLRKLIDERIVRSDGFYERGPVWSPDGRKIAFVARRDGNSEIYVVNADGSGQTNLTNNPAEDWDPSWSPDGQYIAFSSNRVEDGSGSQPSGQRDIFYLPRADQDHVYLMRADGTDPRLLVKGAVFPIWSPKE